MPIGSFSKLARFSDACGAEIPAGCAKKFESFGDDSASIRAFGLDMVGELCRRLLAGGAPGYILLHEPGKFNHGNLHATRMESPLPPLPRSAPMSDPNLPLANRPAPTYGERLRFLPWFLLLAGLITTGVVWWYVRNDGGATLRRNSNPTVPPSSRLRNPPAGYRRTPRRRGPACLPPPRPRPNSFIAYTGAQAGAFASRDCWVSAFAVPVAGAQIEAHVAGQRSSGLPDYAAAPAEGRRFHALVTHVAPGASNQQALGTDLFAATALEEAMATARDEGGVAPRPGRPALSTAAARTTGFSRLRSGFPTRHRPIRRRPAVPPDRLGLCPAFLPRPGEDAIARALGDSAPRLRVRLFDGRGTDLPSTSSDSLPATEPDAGQCAAFASSSSAAAPGHSNSKPGPLSPPG